MSRSLEQRTLGVLLAFVALNAFGGGYYGMTGAPGISTEHLAGSPFNSYFIPGLFLFVVIGGASTYAAVAVFRHWRVAREAAIGVAVLLLFWLAVQIAIIGYQSWLQTVTTVAALLIFLLASRMPRV